MKLIAFLAFVSLATVGWAQAPAKPEAPKAEPMKEEVKPMADAPKQAAAGPRIPKPRRWTEDARHCLELPTPTEVIKCAEEYL
jgi:hypothetical protein